MKAIVQHKHGAPKDALELQEIDKPVAKDDDLPSIMFQIEVAE